MRRWAPALFALALAAGAPAEAQILSQESDNPFAALVGRRREPGEERASLRGVERYVLASDSRAFLFEERGATARVRFLCGPADERIDCVIDGGGPAPEIYQLSATRAPRGDVIYKTGEGDMLLRIAAYGGATVFWPGEGHGVAASKSFGDDRPLTLAYVAADAAQRRAQTAAAYLGAYTGSAVFFDLGPGLKAGPSANYAVLADAIMTAAKGLAAVASDTVGAGVIAERIERVVFLPASAPDVALAGGTLEIRYVPNMDVAGRPSSAMVAKYLEESL
ncbi:MAG: DUF4908 domain-containing protein [Parvularculaceae bacterium]